MKLDSRALIGVALAIAVLLPASASLAQNQAPSRRASDDGERHMWWNSTPYIAKLKLSGEQRTRMDGVYDAYKAEGQSQRKSNRKPYYEAIGSGDWEAARKHLADYTEADRERATREGEMRIAVLSVLDEQQLKTLMEVSGNMIKQPWFARMGWPIRTTRTKANR